MTTLNYGRDKRFSPGIGNEEISRKIFCKKKERKKPILAMKTQQTHYLKRHKILAIEYKKTYKQRLYASIHRGRQFFPEPNKLGLFGSDFLPNGLILGQYIENQLVPV